MGLAQYSGSQCVYPCLDVVKLLAAADRPADVPRGIGQVVGYQSAACARLLDQPLELVHRFPRDVLAGDRVRGEIAWATLASLEPAIGTLAFATRRGGVLWRHEVDIPGDADIVTVDFALAEAAPAGSALYFHVRNHGYNAWQLSPLTLTEPQR